MASRKILLAHGRYGPERVDVGDIVPVYVAVPGRRYFRGMFKSGETLSGLWAYDLRDARVRVSDWLADNRLPASAVKIVKAYVVGYGGTKWRSTW